MLIASPLEKETFIRLVIEKLGRSAIDYRERMRWIKEDTASSRDHQSAGVLLLLNHRKNESYRGQGADGFYFQLIKRSSRVAQPGDLSCPGGMLDPFLDPLLRPLVRYGVLPIIKGSALAFARERDEDTFHFITLYLTNAMRESWEEIGLSPLNVLFLGPLPTHTLLLFQRTIFPLVGISRHPWSIRTNEEVERLVEIPLKSFFEASCFGRYLIDSPDPALSRPEGRQYWEFPCLINRDDLGNEDILWGATFNIIVSFLEKVFDYRLPDWQSQRVIKRMLPENYITGQKP